ncbi:DUF3072 domain-containing protein [Kocuria marina subsp. indica]|uniref:DUF3072 domain-containing protein n=1 Tax=Kocuria marina subsp. indica TaxID=1049583 RepID=A0A1X7DG04_9MICC|nr:DUF3072 domain-containing protein [Kocuria indica]RLP57539.1 DUF3072 domain-containing protein [Kocuria indica]SMF14590.1 Protein of unknown function [Kocuria indica]
MTETPAQDPQGGQPPLENGTPDGALPDQAANGAGGAASGAPANGAPQGETIGATGDAQDSSLEKDPSTWVSGDEPMTASQKSYLDTLAKQAGEELPADLTKAEASQHIERLKGSQN